LEKKGIHFYIEKELQISEYESEKLAEVLGDDFFKVKNEVEKIKSFLNGKTFILEEILPILSVSDEYNLKKLVEDFMITDNISILIEYLKKTKEYMLFLYLIFYFHFLLSPEAPAKDDGEKLTIVQLPRMHCFAVS